MNTDAIRQRMQQADRDAEFVAHAREDIAALLDALDALDRSAAVAPAPAAEPTSTP